jgi:hypothetical protein
MAIITCNLPKHEEKLNTDLSDLEAQIRRFNVKEGPLSNLVLIYGELEILSNYDSISISLDTTNDEIKNEMRSKPRDKKFWELYDLCCSNYSDSVNELISVRNFETIYMKKSYGSISDRYDSDGKEDFRSLPKGIYKQYYFSTTYPGTHEFDSINFEIEYIKNGETLRKKVGRHR